MLSAWLDYHRATLAMKCEGLSAEQLRSAAIPPSTLSLLGLVRHMAEVERGWFRRTLAGENAPPIYYNMPALRSCMRAEILMSSRGIRHSGSPEMNKGRMSLW